MHRQPIVDALGSHPFFGDISVAHRRAIAECSTQVQLEPGELLFRTGEPADRCYVVFGGQGIVEMDGAGSTFVDAVSAGDVIGWSWLFPPYRAHFDVRVCTPMQALMLDGITLRLRCDEDPALGYELARRIAMLLAHRLEALGRLLARSQRTKEKA